MLENPEYPGHGVIDRPAIRALLKLETAIVVGEHPCTLAKDPDFRRLCLIPIIGDYYHILRSNSTTSKEQNQRWRSGTSFEDFFSEKRFAGARYCWVMAGHTLNLEISC